MVYNYSRLLLFIHSPSCGDPLFTSFQIPSVPLSFIRIVAVEWDSTSVDKLIILIRLRVYKMGRHVKENRRAEATEE
jgi:hypothetical protein